MKNTKLLHHSATALGFAFLILCYYLLQEVGYFNLISGFFPLEYAGAGLMLGIGSGMLVPFALWNRFTKWTEKRLNIKGRYYEDSYYNEPTHTKDNKDH
ncbi:MAG: hypothetical protein ACPG4U_04750 [Pseudomonadales bacterium]